MSSAYKNTQGESGPSRDGWRQFTVGELLVVRPDAYAGATSPARRLRPNVFETKPAGSESLGSTPVEPEWPQAVEVVELRPVSVIRPGVACSNRRRPNRRPRRLI